MTEGPKIELRTNEEGMPWLAIVAANGEVTFMSEMYSSRAAAIRAARENMPNLPLYDAATDAEIFSAMPGK